MDHLSTHPRRLRHKVHPVARSSFPLIYFSNSHLHHSEGFVRRVPVQLLVLAHVHHGSRVYASIARSARDSKHAQERVDTPSGRGGMIFQQLERARQKGVRERQRQVRRGEREGGSTTSRETLRYAGRGMCKYVDRKLIVVKSKMRLRVAKVKQGEVNNRRPQWKRT